MAPSVERQSGTDRPPQPGGGEISPKVQADTDRSTILLVEDDPDIRDALRDQIVGLGYNVVVASDGTESLSQSERGQRIDLLFTDIVMPGDCAVACRH
ncbi:MAG: response regulator [Alphaproteobacteria bacterium]